MVDELAGEPGDELAVSKGEDPLLSLASEKRERLRHMAVALEQRLEALPVEVRREVGRRLAAQLLGIVRCPSTVDNDEVEHTAE